MQIAAFPPEATEDALAHVIRAKAQAACKRGDKPAKRRRMMDAWPDNAEDGAGD